MLQGKKILLGISGSIAAYKAALLVRLCVKAGAEVKVVMTPSAGNFITPLTLSTLSKNPVISELSVSGVWADHVHLGRWADCMLIAPLSCNTLSKMAHGACDNLLMAVYLSATCPVVVAPAMDVDMWKHPSTVSNLEKIRSYGNRVIPVSNGELASGLFGEGRMAEPEEILNYLLAEIFITGALSGKKALVTAGPTYEAIDPVRFVGNHSTGKMGIAIAKALRAHGADVELVLGPVTADLKVPGIRVTRVQSAEEMYNACQMLFPQSDVAIMSAAVADYTPKEKSTEKIKKKLDEWALSFVRTRDILKSLGAQKKQHQLLVGFALETTNEKENALEKLRGKNADMIVLNSLNDPGAGFGHNTNKVTIFDREGNQYDFDTKSKDAVAGDITDLIIRKIHA
jgi:phosphopantothenoylcysteine decarboxylase / phosphopantothenate---cysteine ligase